MSWLHVSLTPRGNTMGRTNRTMAAKNDKARAQAKAYAYEAAKRNEFFEENVARNVLGVRGLTTIAHTAIERGTAHVHRYRPTDVPRSARPIIPTSRTRDCTIACRAAFNQRTMAERAKHAPDMATRLRRSLRDLLTGEDYSC